MKNLHIHIPPFIALAAVALWGYKFPYLVFVILVALGAFMIFYKYKKEKLFTFLYIAIFGPIAEGVAIIFGQWNYTFHNLYNIPVWLLPLWGCAGLYIVNVYKEIIRLNKKTA